MSATRRLRRFPFGAAIVVAILLVGTLIPIYWMLSMSLKSSPELAQIPVTLFPKSITLDQYAKLFSESPIASATVQSVVVAFFTTLIVLLLGACAAYAVTHLRLRSRKGLLSLSVVTQFLPQAAILVPIFIIWTALGLINNLPGLVVIYVGFQLPVAVWILSGYFASIPAEVVEAASMDGAGAVRTLTTVVIPMAAPGMAAVALWCAIGCWSELLFSLILLNGSFQTVPVAISGLIGQFSTDTGMLLAGATISALPPLIVFFVLQKYLVNGLAGSVKG